MDRMNKHAYAKINLFLDVVSKYDDGYHEVNTIMQSISLCDEISVERCNKGISLFCDREDVPNDERNIAWRAADAFFTECRLIGTEINDGASIRIEKNIPSQAGLGGGSADAAAVLLALNEMYGYPISKERLIEIGASIGADVPFCMIGGTAFAYGKGTLIEKMNDMPDCHIVIARGGEGISTPWAYGELDRVFGNFKSGEYLPYDSMDMVKGIEGESLEEIGRAVYNIFETVIVPERATVAELKKIMAGYGALAAVMSGSGTAVFGLFQNEENANKAANEIASLGYFSYIARPVSNIMI